MFGDKKFTFTEAMKSGIYFDRCIDLQAFDSDMNYLWSLNTPKTGYKPDITVKGSLIEGSQAISSFISITNLSYSADINNVAYILCRMYYRGLEGKEVGDLKNYKGHSILFSVLYADQEKEPPNRAVRFQCTVAAEDYTRAGCYIYVDGNGKFSKEKIQDNGTIASGDKTSILKPMKEVLLEMAKIYNSSLEPKFKKETNRTKDLQIYNVYFECEAHEDVKIPVANYSGTMLGLINTINATPVIINEQYLNPWKVIINEGQLKVCIVPPSDSKLNENKYFKERENGGSYSVVTTQTSSQGNETDSQKSKVIELFYVNSSYASGATREEVIISASTIFDDRIYPGCMCAIMGNTLMGRNRKKSVANEGSKLSKVTDEVVVFRATSNIDFEFSTTQKSSMSLKGPQILFNLDWNAYQNWKKGYNNS